MDYATWLIWMVTTLEVNDEAGVEAFTAIAPMIIAMAEGRLYRDPELDFLATRKADLSKLTTPGQRSVAIPDSFIVLEGVSLLTPANATNPAQTDVRRIPYQRATRDFLDFIWPIESQTKAPDPLNGGYYALFSQQQASPASGEDEPSPLPSAVLLAPTPDNEYRVEMTGTMRPDPLSETNTRTFLTTYLPDLFFAAGMIAGSAYQRDFGAQVADPHMAMSWERLYEQLRKDAGIEELRKKALADGYSSLPPRTATAPAELAARAAQAQAG